MTHLVIRVGCELASVQHLEAGLDGRERVDTSFAGAVDRIERALEVVERAGELRCRAQRVTRLPTNAKPIRRQELRATGSPPVDALEALD